MPLAKRNSYGLPKDYTHFRFTFPHVDPFNEQVDEAIFKLDLYFQVSIAEQGVLGTLLGTFLDYRRCGTKHWPSTFLFKNRDFSSKLR